MKRTLVFALLACARLHAASWEQDIQAAAKLHKKGNLKGAEAGLLKTLLNAEAFGEEDPRLAYTLDYLGTLNMQMQEADKAVPMFERAVRCFGKSRGGDAAETLQAMGRLAEAHESRGDYAKSEPLWKSILELRKGDELARSVDLNNLAVSLDAQGRQDEALAGYQQALDLREARLGKQSTDLCELLNNLARVYYMKGAYATAEPLYRRAIGIDERVLGPKHPLLADDYSRLVPLLRKTGREAEALDLEAKAKAIQAPPKKKKKK